jgi:hypothetical protein
MIGPGKTAKPNSFRTQGSAIANKDLGFAIDTVTMC